MASLPLMEGKPIDVRKAAELARIHLSDEEASQFSSQLGDVLEYVDQLNSLDVSNVEATAHANPVFDVTRPDVSRPGFGVEKALLNAPQKTSDQFLVTKVVE
jgi:aspartyl-tRNA(Asn)/glutamyl-tRNA(Gln) amidotransferase subunit C